MRSPTVSMDMHTAGKADVITVSDLGEFGLIKRVTAGLTPGRLDPARARRRRGRRRRAGRAGRRRRPTCSSRTATSGATGRRRTTSGTRRRPAASPTSSRWVRCPTSLLVGFGAPGDLAVDWVDGLVAGLREECGEVGAAIVGGDVTAAERDHPRAHRAGRPAGPAAGDCWTGRGPATSSPSPAGWAGRRPGFAVLSARIPFAGSSGQRAPPAGAAVRRGAGRGRSRRDRR